MPIGSNYWSEMRSRKSVVRSGASQLPPPWCHGNPLSPNTPTQVCQGRVSRHFRICPNVDDCSSDLPCLIWSITQCVGHGPVRYVVVVPVFTRPGLYRAVQALCTATQVTSFTRHLSQTYSAPTAYYGDTGVGRRERTEFSLDIILADIIQLKAAWCNSSVPEQSQNWYWSEQPVKQSPTNTHKERYAVFVSVPT